VDERHRNVIREQANFPTSEDPQILAIGKFDGVHLGHQAVLSAARSEIGNRLTQLSVLTFSPHPTYVLTGREEYRRVLTPSSMKADVLASYGVSRIYEVPFDNTYANTSADVFVKEHLARLHLQAVVVGEDFRFGQGGNADVETLSRLCSEIGVSVRIVPASIDDKTKISSSQIRLHLTEGHIEKANRLLGRPYGIRGEVVHGEKLGREIGFPTANLGGTDEYVLPKTGVYLVEVSFETKETKRMTPLYGVLNAGFRPTVNGSTYRMEVHLLDFNENIYGQEMEVKFLERLRDEQRFANLAALQTQIHLDVQRAREKVAVFASEYQGMI
jgi:riboflavin kinase / FMN adenylyltransferase